MSGLHVFYRLSDKGEKKQKLASISNQACLENFLTHFPASEVTVVADNVSDETMQWLNGVTGISIVRTALGNSGSFWECYTLATALDDDARVYFVENDYLHRTGSRTALLEGLTIADYVTLYDHPDKYVDGVNPLVKRGGENTVVRLTASCHWKYTNSTTMTFAAKAATLKQDQLIFKNYTVGLIGLIAGRRLPGLRRLQPKRVPGDFPLFRALANLKRRKLASPLPSYSTHGETAYIAPFFEDLLANEV